MLLLLGAATLAPLGHVPVYGSQGDCIVPPKVHSTSQVVYLRGSSGIEVHCSAASCPFDYASGELLDIDLTFRKRYARDTFAVHIGCLGCVAGEDPIAVPPTPVNYADDFDLEPFTASAYLSGLTEAQKVFNSSLLDPTNGCEQGHFSIRLVQFPNATEDVVWGAVLGKAEVFSNSDILSFPIFIVATHGDAWTGMPWTLPLLAFLVPLLDLLRGSFAWYWGDEDALWVPTILFQTSSPRAWCLQLAAWSFLIAATELIVHATVAQSVSVLNYALVIVAMIILICQFGPWLLTVVIWNAMIDGETCTASAWWAPLEICAACSFLWLFGSGLYAGPVALAISGFLHLTELLPPVRAVKAVDDEMEMALQGARAAQPVV